MWPLTSAPTAGHIVRSLRIRYRTPLVICAQGHPPNIQGMRPHLPHPAAHLGGTRSLGRSEPQQAASGTGSSASGVGAAAPNGYASLSPGSQPRPAGRLGPMAGQGGFRPPVGAGPRPYGQPPPAPVSGTQQQAAAPVPSVNRAMGAPMLPPSRPASGRQQPPVPGQSQGQQQHAPPQRGLAALGPIRFGQPASGSTGPAAMPTVSSAGVPQQGGPAAHRPSVSSPSAASAQRQPPPPPFGAAPSAVQHGPVPALGPPSTGAFSPVALALQIICCPPLLGARWESLPSSRAWAHGHSAWACCHRTGARRAAAPAAACPAVWQHCQRTCAGSQRLSHRSSPDPKATCRRCGGTRRRR